MSNFLDSIYFLSRWAAWPFYYSAMASPDDEIEPAAVSSAVPHLNKRRFSHDRHDLKLDELDSLLKNTGM